MLIGDCFLPLHFSQTSPHFKGPKTKSFYNDYINDTHMEELVLYWIQYKHSLKYKVICFWRISYVYTVN